MNTNQILFQQHINSLGSINEWIISSRNNKTIIVNLYSLDQFLPFRFIQSNHGKLFQQFKLRHLYTLPHTPKIILLPNILKPNQEILLLAQRGQFQFHKLITKCHGNYKMLLELILQVVETIFMLQKKYGYFKLTENMLRASKGPSLLIWISEDQTSNNPQFPIGPLQPVNLQRIEERQPKRNTIKDNQMYNMVISMLHVLSQKLPNNQMIIELLKERSDNMNFSYVIKKINNTIINQSVDQCQIQSNVSIEKYKTYTEEKKRKMPEFLLNKCNYSNKKKQKQKNTDELLNKKSAINYINNQSNYQPKINTQQLDKRNVDKKVVFQQKPDKIKYFFNQKRVNKSKPHVECQESLPVNANHHGQYTNRVTPSNSPKQNQIKKQKDEKRLVRDSGKTSSTTSAHYLSVNSSGRKFFQNNFSIDIWESSESNIPIRTVQQKIQSIFTRSNYKNQEQNKSFFYKQNTNKLQTKISKIIEQNTQQPNTTSIKNSKSNPLNPLSINKSSLSITQKSISPGSQFYNDVDILLRSAVLSENHYEDEQNKNLEKEFEQILRD